MEVGPAQRYYRSLEGSWSGAFGLALTKRDAAAGRPTSALRAMAALSALVSGARMSTTLTALDPASFRHTTRVSKWGLTVFETEETITVAEDGRSMRLEGVQRPRLGRPTSYEADGEVDDTGTQATYRIPWAGTDLLQKTRITEEGLELSQETTWSRAFVLLRRTGARRAS